ncbi:Bcr/CflA family efflux MFS transporter [Corynebacterium bovis]|uniref:DHA1 family bicyclomycin/chloramphenicol resistance-like MFS transporter n=1 Tax=Corynebacterium bovis DSM 20582 = CIP 54.80 TaxID=927655 RepID=A0A8H9Y8M5_9CORY|nr:Bcr/CflA family efflux MFS transporter [Corynebacterium bovis]MBB3115491.1 DHA1 family bicyclomycin/chloramphenicol resistance-like MFS transporter [Corynebacterium bovis DSM 20582 = CIP 54.80]MDK8510072.1 Bcr/CflA family efflux MFS transporter [Corynebacterium bovis]
MNTPRDTSSTPSRSSMPLGLLAGIALLAAGGPLGTDMYLSTLPAIARDLDAADAVTQLSITAFMLGMGVGQVVVGPVSDRVGRHRLLVVGAVAGVVGSVACALSPHIAVLILARLVQGAAGGTGVVLGRAVIADLVSGAAAARAFSVMMLIIGLGPVAAPVIGGVLGGAVGWRGIFALLAVVAVGQFVVAWRMPETLPPERRFGGSLGMTYRRMGQLLARRAFMGQTLCFALGFGTMFSFISGSSFVMQEQLGMSPLGFSLVFAVNAAALIVGNIVTMRIVGRTGPRVLQTVAMGLQVVGVVALLLVALSHPGPGGGSVAAVLGCTLVVTLGSSLNFGNTTSIAQGMAADRAGAASAVLGGVQFLVAGIVSPLVGLGEDSLLTMAVVMAVCSAGAVSGVVLSRTAREAR